jgi:hypothetical protein
MGVSGMPGVSRRGRLSLPEAADKLAIRELVDAYACCADRRDTAGQLSLFTEDADVVVYADSSDPVPIKKIRGRAALAPVCDQLNACQATMHLNGQSITRIEGVRASGVTYCMAYQLKDDGSARRLVTAAIRYLDSFVKQDGRWFIRQRQVIIAWTETRSLATR